MFWIAFDGFFFGLTYSLLRIVGEMAVFRRERLAGLSVAPMWHPRSQRCFRCWPE